MRRKQRGFGSTEPGGWCFKGSTGGAGAPVCAENSEALEAQNQAAGASKGVQEGLVLLYAQKTARLWKHRTRRLVLQREYRRGWCSCMRRKQRGFGSTEPGGWCFKGSTGGG